MRSDRATIIRKMRVVLLKITQYCLLYTSYYMAIGALQVINEKGIRIPDQLSFIAYDHMEFAGIMTPNISTVSQPLDEIGRVAAERIVQRIKGNMENYPQVDRLKTSLNLTGSVKSL